MYQEDHDNVMRRVCVCGHLYGDHAWDEDDSYCIRCLSHQIQCRDFEEINPDNSRNDEKLLSR